MKKSQAERISRARSKKKSLSKVPKWTEDVGFYEWLCSVNYAQRIEGSIEVRPFLSLGVVLYMHEAYRAGIENGKTPKD